MNLAGLQATFARNKMPFALAGVALVGVLAWRARTSKPASTSAPLAAGTSSYPTSSAPGYSSAAGYSSTGSDVYSAIQPQLEAIGQTQAQLQAMMGKTQTPPIPVPAAPDLGQGFFRKAGQSAVYQLHNNGSLEWVSAPAYAALGNPSVTDLTPGNALWSAPLVGADAPANQK